LETKVLKITKFGPPKSVLKLETETITEIPNSHVVVRMKAAPITHYDIGVIRGQVKVPNIPPAGSEGYGEVIAAAPDVPQSLVGKHVIPLKPDLGTWRTHLVANHEDLLTIPKELPPGQAATLRSVLTASQLLDSILRLREGDVIVQSAAAGTVGLAVVQLAARKGVKTINIYNPTVDSEEVTRQIKDFGGTVVCSENFADQYAFREVLSDLPPPRLALDCIGGTNATRVLKLLGKGGTFVSFGSLTKQPFHVSPSSLFEKDIKLRGFSLNLWRNFRTRLDVQKTIDELTVKPVTVWTEHLPFTEFSRALTAHDSPIRLRKILLAMSV